MVRRERQWPGVGGRRGEWILRRLHEDWDGNLSLGALPLPLFMNGHAYFVQAAHRSLQVSPFAVHATYSLDNHDGVAKRQRFREAGLWLADGEEYFRGRFLALNASVPPAVAAALGAARSAGQSPNHIGVHAAALRGYLAELRDALALARALGRTLVLPRWTCYVDKLWAGSDNIIGMGFMYPGSQDAPFLPFACPMDHVLSPAAWEKAEVDYRDGSFLSSPRLSPELTAAAAGAQLLDDRERRLLTRLRCEQAAVGVQLLERSAYDAAAEAGGSATLLPLGATAVEAAKLLGGRSGGAALLRLPHARGLLCGVGGRPAATREFNHFAQPLLRAPAWCARCAKREGCPSNLAKWLTPEQTGSPRGHGEWCLRTPQPPRFRPGQCVLNDAVT